MFSVTVLYMLRRCYQGSSLHTYILHHIVQKLYAYLIIWLHFCTIWCRYHTKTQNQIWLDILTYLHHIKFDYIYKNAKTKNRNFIYSLYYICIPSKVHVSIYECMMHICIYMYDVHVEYVCLMYDVCHMYLVPMCHTLVP